VNTVKACRTCRWPTIGVISEHTAKIRRLDADPTPDGTIALCGGTVDGIPLAATIRGTYTGARYVRHRCAEEARP
jgi:hypothetical protein